ncbi:MAG: hypothetical protein ACRDVL_09200 [Acidimicrobiia bacterium]
MAVRTVGPGLAAVLLTAATFSASALFQAPLPGADLEPVDGAAQVVQLLQGQRSMLWTSLGGNVSSITVTGWPTQEQDNELGGALMIQRPADGSAGVVKFGEKPMALRFDMGH